MIKIEKTTAKNTDFIKLVALLDNSLALTDGNEHAFYDQYNKLDHIKYAIVIYKDDQAIGCGAIKEFDQHRVEIKRMYVLAQQRGKGIASKILTALEDWAKELGYQKCILECGKRQPDAIGCYQKNNYTQITNYGQYKGIANSVCFEKVL